MRTSVIKLTLVGIIISIFFGCFPYKKAVPPFSKNLDDTTEHSLAPESRYYYFTEAQLQRKTGNYDKAIQYLNKAIETDPESVYLRLELATLYILIKENQRALNIVEEVIEKEPENINALIMYGKLKQELNQLDDAEAVYEKIIAMDPKQENIYLLLGGLYIQEEKLNRALKIYNQLIQNFPESYVGHFFIAKIFKEQNNTFGAIKELKKTLEINSDLEEPRYELIGLYKTMGEEKKVIRLYQELLKKNSLNIRAAMELGLYYHERGMTQAAGKIFKDLGERSIAQQEVIRKVVNLYLNTKEYDAAAVILEGMLKGAPESSELYYLAGIVFDENKDKNKAIMHLKKVAADSSFYKEAVVHIAFLYQEQKKIFVSKLPKTRSGKIMRRVLK
ncbi:MAG: tetratricopeptide repeat protein, partial [Desulfobacterales bacterium]